MDGADKLARVLAKQLPPMAKAILGDGVELGKPSHTRELAVPDGAYVARLETSGGEAAWIVIEIEAAIAAAGLMLQRPDARIKEQVQAKALEEDDFDALGELVNQLTAPLNTAIEAVPGEALHFTFKRGTADGSDAPGGERPLVASFRLIAADIGQGALQLVIPRRAFEVDDIESAAAERSPLELTAEEVEALREATREAARGSTVGRALVFVPIAREHAPWEAVLHVAGLDYRLTADLYGSLAALRAGEFDFVIVDADSCAAGGLPAIARIRSAAPRLRTIIAASSPTRRHIMACLAAGVFRYVSKPIAFPRLIDDLTAAS